jgi:rhamnosyltransferase subunit B
MRVLISTIGSHGDVLPFVAIGSELANRGHEVILYGNPEFAGYVSDPAIRFVSIGTRADYAALFAEVSEDNPGKALQTVSREFARTCGMYYQAMKADAVPGNTLCISGTLLFAARLLRETHGVPCATVHLAPSVVRSDQRPARLAPHWVSAGSPSLIKRMAWWAMDKFFLDPGFTVPLNRLRADLGLRPVSRIFRSWLHEADVVVGLFPAWFATPAKDWPPHLTLTDFPLYDHAQAMPLPPALQDFLQAGPPPVAFSAGTASAVAQGFFKTSLQATEKTNLRAIFLSTFAAQVPASLPKHIMHVRYAPFGALLPQLAAFVHHGGIGSTSQALRAGVPQLIRPVAYDQFDNSQRAVELGVAAELLPRQYTAQKVADALQTLSTDTLLHQRCHHIAQRLAAGSSVSTACDTILNRLCHTGLLPQRPLTESRMPATP